MMMPRANQRVLMGPLYLYLYLWLMSEIAAQVQTPISYKNLSKRFLNMLTVDASMTCCGKLFQLLTILLEKNVLHTVL